MISIISNICSDKTKVKVTLQGQILKFLQIGLLGVDFNFSQITCYTLNFQVEWLPRSQPTTHEGGILCLSTEYTWFPKSSGRLYERDPVQEGTTITPSRRIGCTIQLCTNCCCFRDSNLKMTVREDLLHWSQCFWSVSCTEQTYSQTIQCLTLSHKTNFRPSQTEKACRRQF